MQHALIMAGGSGTRFWPQSRKAMPKQLLRLTGERTLIQSAFDRTQPDIDPGRVWVVTNAAQAAATRTQLPGIPPRHILIEPCGRNTAPCIGLAAIQLLREDPEAVMIVMPADHVIAPPEAFRDALGRAADLIADDPTRLVLFGVPPTFPAVGYGYIERGPLLEGADAAWHVASFREKPDRTTAQQYLDAGTFSWNCGIFVWRADRLLAALKDFEPEMYALLESLRPALGTSAWQSELARAFPQMKSVAIDVAVMERAAKPDSGYGVLVIEAPFEWDDVGAWQSLPRRIGQDERGNTVQGRFCGIDTTDSIISTSKDHLVATFGVDNLIIVHTKDATLVARKDDENAVKHLIAKLRKEGHEHFL